jgi:protoporphyrinogen oxidase
VEKVEGDLFTTRRGFSLIVQRMGRRAEEAGAEIRLETAAEKIFRRANAVSGVAVRRRGRTEILPCRGLINTLAINEAAGFVEPAFPAEVAAAAAALRFRAIVFVGLKVRRSRALPASFMYFREHAFNRVSDYSHFGFEIRPAGHTLLVAETTCDADDRIWNDEDAVRRAVRADLEREKILAGDDIVEMRVFKARHAQPMYTLGYERALKKLTDAFDALDNGETAGRQGRFQYVNSHVAMKMGWEAADRLARKLGRS